MSRRLANFACQNHLVDVSTQHALGIVMHLDIRSRSTVFSAAKRPARASVAAPGER